MNHRLAAAAVSLMCTLPAVAGGSPYVVSDASTGTLIDKATVDAIWLAHLQEARLARVYPRRQWGFLSQVVGGLAGGQTCVVTARAVMLPRTYQGDWVKNPVGTGPWLLKEYVAKQKCTATKKPDYWRKDADELAGRGRETGGDLPRIQFVDDLEE